LEEKMSETVAEVPKETQDPKLDEIPKTFPQRVSQAAFLW
jgi:hypothetical protein